MASSDAFDIDAALAAVNAPGARGGLTTPAARVRDLPRMSLRDHEKYVSLTMEFRCNLKCVHCMIEGTMDRLAPTAEDTFARILTDQQQNARWEGLVLTGSEITLRRDLPDLARRARAAGFSHVRIQTHGMHLARPGYTDRLIDAGVDEFFISVAGSDAESHDRIVQVKGAWDKMLRGMEHLDTYDHINMISNSVVTTLSYPLLPDMVDALSHLRRLIQMEFWTYFPMAETDEKNLAARHADILPPLRAAITRARAQGRFVEVKNFPECLLGQQADALVNAQPLLVIDPEFWTEFDRNEFHQCPHRAQCTSTECLGLSAAYVAKYGDERDLLRPLG